MSTSSGATGTASHRGAQRTSLLRQPGFAWLVSGSFITLLGDQFSLIALPWLVLRISGDPLQLGLVLGAMSVPRAVFMLIGGALVDRHSPKAVLMWSKHACTLLLLALGGLVIADRLTLPALYLLAFGLGLAMAFSIPAGSSMLPHVVPPAQLQAANGILLGLRQLTMFIGPVLAGLTIAGIGASTQASPQSSLGIGVAFLVDAATFALSAFTLSRVRLLASPRRPPQAAGVWRSVADGVATAWNDRDLRSCFLYWGAVALLITGPMQVALPVLASRLPGAGANTLGMLAGAHGAGTLLGMVLAGARPGWRAGTLGATLLLVDALVGLLFMPLGHIDSVGPGLALLLAIGVLGGFMQVAIFTWMQRRVPPQMLGRTMSIFMFIFLGVAPLSGALTGWVMRGVALPTLFIACGAALVAAVGVALCFTRIRHVTDAPRAAAG
ncbi:MFS transporter [Ideonella sp. BN130291]|uniref:MFS transporter n=1 Tax=Ideonella sp. BN130291 TaxID=3112940 RepID=UPI002E266806|nr:MFS transporter [Ideonella sp. BN130291]